MKCDDMRCRGYPLNMSEDHEQGFLQFGTQPGPPAYLRTGLGRIVLMSVGVTSVQEQLPRIEWAPPGRLHRLDFSRLVKMPQTF